MTEEILIPCPSCGADLKPDRDVGHSLTIRGSQITMDYQILSGVEVHCPTCGADVSEYLRRVVNGYSRLVTDIFTPADVYGDIREFVRAVKEAVARLPELSSEAKLPPTKALTLRYGLGGNTPVFPRQIGDTVDVSRSWVSQVLDKTIRRLRHPQIAAPIVSALNHGARSSKILQAQLAEAKERVTVLELEAKLSRQRILHAVLEVQEIGDVMMLEIEHLNLPTLAFNGLKRIEGCRTIGDVLAKNPDDILDLLNFGVVSFRALIAALRKLNIKVEEYWGKDLEKRYKL